MEKASICPAAPPWVKESKIGGVPPFRDLGTLLIKITVPLFCFIPGQYQHVKTVITRQFLHAFNFGKMHL